MRTVIYPNELDINGFEPIEESYKTGDTVTDRVTGIRGRIVDHGRLCVSVRGMVYELKKRGL